MEVNDVHRSVWHGIESQKRSATHWANRGQAACQTLKGLGVDEHGAIGGPGHVDLISVHTPGVQDVIEDTLGVLNVIMAAAEGAGILIVATVSRIVT